MIGLDVTSAGPADVGRLAERLDGRDARLR